MKGETLIVQTGKKRRSTNDRTESIGRIIGKKGIATLVALPDTDTLGNKMTPELAERHAARLFSEKGENHPTRPPRRLSILSGPFSI